MGKNQLSPTQTSPLSLLRESKVLERIKSWHGQAGRGFHQFVGPQFGGALVIIGHPSWPSLSVTGVWLAVTRRHHVGLPVFRSISSSMHADTTTPADPSSAVAISLNGNGLPQKRDGSASAISVFEACSVFTRVSACLVAESPTRPFPSKASTDLLPPPSL
jgi:hypothetical protein